MEEEGWEISFSRNGRVCVFPAEAIRAWQRTLTSTEESAFGCKEKCCPDFYFV